MQGFIPHASNKIDLYNLCHLVVFFDDSLLFQSISYVFDQIIMHLLSLYIKSDDTYQNKQLNGSNI